MQYQSGDIINQRYQVIGILGQGGTAITYEVKDLESEVCVAMKVLSLNRVADWKVVDLFEREAKALANLNHPRIPQYIDYFYLDLENTRCFYLIQELIPGRSLAHLVERGWQFQENNVREIAQQILSILVYLHGLNPTVIHRDIKPHNIIQNETGDIYLVDFGAVQDIYRNTLTRGGTFVGTIDYMPPEQLRGQANFSSDLYSLGCTLLYLLTRRSPLRLPLHNLKLDFRDRINISHSFANWLDKAIEPAMEDRFSSTEEALEQLCNYSSFSSLLPSKPQPHYSSLVILKERNRLTIKTSSENNTDYLVNIFLSLIFIAVVAWIFPSILSDLDSNNVKVVFLMSFYFLCIFSPLIWQHISAYDREFSIEIDRLDFKIFLKLLLFKYEIKGKTKDISNLKVIYNKNKQGEFYAQCCTFWHGVKQIKFAHCTSESEKKWIATEIVNFLIKINPKYKNAIQETKN